MQDVTVTFYMLLEGETGCAVFKERPRAVQAALSVESESGVSISRSIGASPLPNLRILTSCSIRPAGAVRRNRKTAMPLCFL